MVTKSPTTTGGSAIPVLMRLTTRCLPGNCVNATTVPMDIPIKRLINVAVPETFRENQVIPMTSGSRLKSRMKACRIPSRMISIYAFRFSNGYRPRSSTFFPASGKKSGEPYLSTPKVFITAWASLETMKSAKAFPPAKLALGHFLGLTSMTW